MRREAVGYIAALAAAVSLGALGYAVVWGVDPADLGRRSGARQAPSAPPAIAPRVVLAPPPQGEDAMPAAALALGPVASADEAARSAAPASPSGQPSALGPIMQAMPLIPGLDAPPIAALSPRPAEASAAIELPLPEPAPLASALIPQEAMLEPPADAPAALPDPEPVGTIAPAEPPASGTLPPASEVLRLNPAARPVPSRALRPRGPRVEPEPLEPKGITIVRGIPAAPKGSPAIVAPGPLIIHVPDSMRR